MRSDEFELIATLIRSRGPARSAARRVLVDGLRNADAAREASIDPQSVHRTAQRIHSEVERAREIFSGRRVDEK